MKIRDMTIDQIIRFCDKRSRKYDHDTSACNECPFNYSGNSCMFWEGGFNLYAVDREVDVDDTHLSPIDIYNKFQEEFPEMLEDMIGWECDEDMIENKRIAIRIRRDPLPQELWLYDYEDNDMIRVE